MTEGLSSAMWVFVRLVLSVYLDVITWAALAVFRHNSVESEHNLLWSRRPNGPRTVQVVTVVCRIPFILYHASPRHEQVPITISCQCATIYPFYYFCLSKAELCFNLIINSVYYWNLFEKISNFINGIWFPSI